MSVRSRLRLPAGGSLFQVVAGIISPLIATDDIGVAEGERIYFDADQGAPNDYIYNDGFFIYIAEDGSTILRLGNNTLTIYGVLHPFDDNNISLGQAAKRLKEGLFGTEVGHHNGSAFLNSLDNVGVKLSGLQGCVYHSGDFVQAGVDGSHALMLPNMTTAERDALTAVNGMIIYNTTMNEVQAYVGSAWRMLSDVAPGS